MSDKARKKAKEMREKKHGKKESPPIMEFQPPAGEPCPAGTGSRLLLAGAEAPAWRRMVAELSTAVAGGWLAARRGGGGCEQGQDW
jgi:hypothetical protein